MRPAPRRCTPYRLIPRRDRAGAGPDHTGVALIILAAAAGAALVLVAAAMFIQVLR